MITSAAEFVRLRFSEDPNEYGRAANEPAAVAVWLEIIQTYPEARLWVAHNKTVPMEILSILASDQNPEVRHMVSMKRKLSPELLAQLAKDTDESIRLQVARHRRTPQTVLEGLSRDPWAAVAAIATERLGTNE